jgi:predicted ribosome quality control (RQC) complex YloA/Tae2 family protein
VLATHPGLASGQPPAPRDDARLSRAELVVHGPALLRAEATELLTSARRALGTTLARTLKRLTRKLHAIEADAARADHAPQLRLDADLLLAHGNQVERAPDGTGWVTAQDWSQDPPAERRLPLDRGERPADRAARLYHQARRLERGAKVAEERWLLAEAQLGEVRALAERCGSASTLSELDALAKAALALGIRELDDTAPSAVGRRGAGKRRPSKADHERNPFRRFVSSSGHPIWVGRSARENDALTLHHAKPYHVWLHVEGRSGSHVIIPLIRGAELPSDLLIDAAHLAAHFSDARSEAVVEVIYAERRHVVKPRGYPPGAVRVDRRKTLALRQEPARRDALLAGERRV